ncbi:MAG: B12-binding domain-containing radical SAM protein [Rhodospirillales bacterium]|nr:B12-binding domain-containing radical SAM protein [Rhodospirillales bacterium]
MVTIDEPAPKKLNVALVRPPIFFKRHGLANEATPCLGLAYISGYLKKYGYSPVFIDGIAEALNKVWEPEMYPEFLCQGLTFDEVIRRIPNQTDVICVTAMFSGEWPFVRDLINQIREQFPDAVIIAGGEHITALPDYCLKDCNGLDVCVLGEGEHKCYEILEVISNEGAYGDIAGIGYLNEAGEYVQTSTSLPRIRDIDSIPWPDWPEGYLEKFWAAGKSFGPQSARDMPMMFSRGCPYQCTFCSNPNMWTTRYILRDIDDVLAEVKSYIKDYNITAVQLYDLTAITKKRWIKEFLSELKRQDIKVQWDFPSGTRSEILDEETLSNLKDAGTNYLCFAPESGSPNMLEKLKKRIDLNKMTDAMKIAKKLGLVVRANTIIGFPGEKRRDTMRTLFYGVKLSIMGVDELQPYIFMPYPGSELFGKLAAEGKIDVNDDYFFSLSGLNSDLLSFSPLTFNEQMGPRELALYRLLFTMLTYGLSYLLYPSRIVRTVRNLISNEDATTVFEHRLKDAFRRKKISP